MTPKERAAIQRALESLSMYEQTNNDVFWDEAITALEKALAEPDIEEMTLTQIAARHEQAEQEPVAWMRLNEKSECEAIEYIGNVDEHLYLPPSCQWLYTSPVLTMQQVEPKPVAKVGHLHQSIVEACGLPMSTPLYTHPVRTKDLTDEELWEAAKTAKSNDLTDAFRAVIAADREKNK